MRPHPEERRVGTARCISKDHFFSFFLYMASMRCVTRKPPNMFTDASTSATKPSPLDDQDSLETAGTDTAISSRTPITDEAALVTLTSGVCNGGVTHQTAKQPMKIAMTK